MENDLLLTIHILRGQQVYFQLFSYSNSLRYPAEETYQKDAIIISGGDRFTVRSTSETMENEFEPERLRL